MARHLPWSLIVALGLICSILAGCGGSAQQTVVTPPSASTSGTSTPPSPVPSPSAEATLQSLAVSPPTLSTRTGSTQQFTAAGTFSDGRLVDLTSAVTWRSSQPAVRVANLAGAKGLAIATAPAASVDVTATLQGFSGRSVVTVAPHTLVSIGVTPAAPTVAIGTGVQLVATGVFSDGSTQDLSQTVTWTSASPAVASVTAAGLASGLTAGTSAISASQAGVTGSTILTATGASLVSLQVTPAQSSIGVGTTTQYTATGVFSDKSTEDLTRQVVWTTSSPNVTITASGLASGVSAVNNATVTATFGAVSGTAQLTVTSATLTSIVVFPPVPRIALGTSKQFSAVGIFSDGSAQSLTTAVSWRSSDASVAVVTRQGLAISVDSGRATITATLGTVSGSATLFVTAATLASIAVTPATQTIAKATSLQYTAVGTFSDGSTQDLTTQVAWASSSAAVTISNAAGSNGVAFGVSAVSGAAVTATLGQVAGTASLSVTPATLVSIAVNPPTLSIQFGSTRAMQATGTFSDGTPQDLTRFVSWSSSATAVATVDASGLLTAVSPGTATITAARSGVSGTSAVTVNPAFLIRITVTPATQTIRLGDSLQYTATGTFSDGAVFDMTTAVVWRSSSPAVTISNAPDTRGLAVGASAVTGAQITASRGGVTGTATLTVNAGGPPLFVANQTGGNISAFSIDAGGVLNGIAGSPFATAAAQPTLLKATADGQFLYATSPSLGAGSVSGFIIHGGDGTLSPIAGSPFNAAFPTAMAITGDSTFAYVAQRDRTVAAFEINRTSGALTLQGAPVIGASVGLTVSDNSRFLYSANPLVPITTGYSIDGAVLTQVTSASTNPLISSIVSGRFLFVSQALPEISVSGSLVSYSIDPISGVLTQNGYLVNTRCPRALALDPRGRFLFAMTNYPGQPKLASLSVFTINFSSGALTDLGVGFPLGADPSSVAVDQTGTNVYVTNKGSNNITAYAVNQQTGYLTEIAGSPFAAGTGPTSIVTTP